MYFIEPLKTVMLASAFGGGGSGSESSGTGSGGGLAAEAPDATHPLYVAIESVYDMAFIGMGCGAVVAGR